LKNQLPMKVGTIQGISPPMQVAQPSAVAVNAKGVLVHARFIGTSHSVALDVLFTDNNAGKTPRQALLLPKARAASAAELRVSFNACGDAVVVSSESFVCVVYVYGLTGAERYAT
jgi:hypothetical protein